MTGRKALTSWVPAGVRRRASTAAEPLRHPPFWVGTAIGAVAVLLAVVVVPLVRGDRDAQENGPLVILSGRDDSVNGQRQKLVDEWNSMHPANEQARIEELSPLADDQHSEMLARAQSADPDVDVYNLDVTWTTEFAAAGHIRRLDESRVPAAEFLAGPLSTCRYDGGLYALPFNADVGLLYYRSDLLARIGRKDAPPQDWDTLEGQVADLRRLPDVDDAVPGYVGQLGDYEGLTVTALEMVWGKGGTVVDDDGRVLPDGGDVQALKDGLTRLNRLSPADRSALDEAGSTARFRDGEALFMRNWPVAARRLQEPGDKPAPEFGVAPLPGGSAALGGQNLAISTRTTRPRAARALVEFLTGDRSQQLLFERGGLPATRRVVYLDPRFKDDQVAKALQGALGEAAARRRPAVTRYTEFSKAFRGAVNEYFRDPASLREDALRAELEAALSGRSVPAEPG